MDRRYLTAKEVAELLRTTPGYLANLRMRGEGPPVIHAFSRKVLYDKRDIDAWLERHKVKSVDQAT